MSLFTKIFYCLVGPKLGTAPGTEAKTDSQPVSEYSRLDAATGSLHIHKYSPQPGP